MIAADCVAELSVVVLGIHKISGVLHLVMLQGIGHDLRREGDEDGSDALDHRRRPRRVEAATHIQVHADAGAALLHRHLRLPAEIRNPSRRLLGWLVAVCQAGAVV